MKVELSEVQIKNTLYFLGQVDLRGNKPGVLVEMAALLSLYGSAVERPPALPPVDADAPKPNRAARRRAKKAKP